MIGQYGLLRYDMTRYGNVQHHYTIPTIRIVSCVPTLIPVIVCYADIVLIRCGVYTVV